MDFCEQNGVLVAFKIIGILIFIIKILVPLLLIIVCTYDFAKAFISSEEKVVSEAIAAFIRRFIAAVIIFFIPTIISYVLDLVDGANETLGSFTNCTDCLLKPNECDTQAIGSDINTKEGKDGIKLVDEIESGSSSNSTSENTTDANNSTTTTNTDTQSTSTPSDTTATTSTTDTSSTENAKTDSKTTDNNKTNNSELKVGAGNVCFKNPGTIADKIIKIYGCDDKKCYLDSNRKDSVQRSNTYKPKKGNKCATKYCKKQTNNTYMVVRISRCEGIIDKTGKERIYCYDVDGKTHLQSDLDKNLKNCKK